jgi:acyl-CoA dehydrogenase
MLLGEGRTRLLQGRPNQAALTPALRVIGRAAERALEDMCKRATQRTAFGAHVIRVSRASVAQSRILTSRAFWY